MADPASWVGVLAHGPPADPVLAQTGLTDLGCTDAGAADPALPDPGRSDPAGTGTGLAGTGPADADGVPSPYFDLDVCPADGLDTAARDRAAVHTGAAERLARLGRWEQAYDHLRAAVRLLQGHDQPGDELARLRREHAEARELSRRDSLTATYNRRYLDECLATLLDQPLDPAVRTLGLSVALVDIDHFKQVNDTYGHLLGDRVLQRLVAVLGTDLPTGTFCARFGGEEFALVLPGQRYEEAVSICEAARDRVARHPWWELAEGLRVTVSAGVGHCVGWPTEVERLVGEADTLLYTAKQAGRNAVAFREVRTGLVRLAGGAGGRRGVPQPPHEPDGPDLPRIG